MVRKDNPFWHLASVKILDTLFYGLGLINMPLKGLKFVYICVFFLQLY